ncbi:two-component response regulator-like APRR2 isoform X2 [Argentina anserina]|uniref:two-component response regulator-like APRR2 isoform X2 n=1 Tax=Argentina anserina TaxID=57926 RepID=UPI0021765874|nr:two-component response regulator-like APRR2 isoform X2 [Potentilla anserina]
MVCTASDLEGWKNFPKGLRVLVLDEDTSYSAEIKSKLEAMDYIVTTFCNETEALSAFSSNPEGFHVAIVEVNTSKCDWGFQFLDTAKDMPIIMTSNIHCLNTMMKCISLGAVEFLRKPLCDEKLQNIWQHVVHKAFNAGEKAVSESVKLVRESLLPMLQPKLETEPPKCKISVVTENAPRVVEHDNEQSTGSDKYPAPSTPQIKQGSRLLDDGDCQDQTNCFSEKECGEHDGESKSVETTCGNADDTHQISEPQMPEKIVIKQEKDSPDVSKSEKNLSQPHIRDCTNDTGLATEKLSKIAGLNHSYKPNRKKMKVDWTPELHKKFVHAVEQLGVDQAIPSRILELMKAEGLTRHNVASHLQKYRMHKRHILPKDEDRRMLHPRDPTQMCYYPHKPIMAFPPYHYNNGVSMPPVYPMWGQPASHPSNIQMWGPPSNPPWQSSDSWHWKPPYPGLHADAWGCPVMPQPLQGGYSSYPQTASGVHNAHIVDNGCTMVHNSELHPIASGLNSTHVAGNGHSMARDSSEPHLADEIIDRVVKEAMSQPWLPLPLGLKLPSTEGVLAELSRQGISNIPPINGSNFR